MSGFVGTRYGWSVRHTNGRAVGSMLCILFAGVVSVGPSGCGSAASDSSNADGAAGQDAGAGSGGAHQGGSHQGGSAQGGGGLAAGTGGGSELDAGVGDVGTAGTGYADADVSDTQGDAAPDGSPQGPTDCERVEKFETVASSSVGESEKLQAAHELMGELRNTGGLPVRCGDEVTFLFETPSGFAWPHVVGDFNSFDVSANPMQHVAAGVYLLTMPVQKGAHRYKYKFSDGTKWMADPGARRFGYDQYGEYSLVSGGDTQGHLERVASVAGMGLAPRPLTIYLPPGYETTSSSYPVLYAHDGQNLFDPDAPWGGWHMDTAIETMLSAKEIKPFIVVGIHNTSERMNEYTQVQDILDGGPVGGKAELYYGLVHSRIMPLIEGRYRVKKGPANTWTMGSSLGGLVSLYFGLKHADTFGRVAGMSSTVGWGSIGSDGETLIDVAGATAHQDITIYLDSGGGDGGPPGCVDSDQDGIDDDDQAATDNYCETVQLRDVLESQGYQFGKDLFHWHEAGAPHNEAAWAARVFRPLTVLASK